MLPLFCRSLFLMSTFVLLQSSARGQLVSPQIGSQAQLSTFGEDVSGTVTILDQDTVRVDDFTYSGGGNPVYFYLGLVESKSGFRTGLRIGSILNGTTFDGTQGPLLVDLPAGETLEGYQAISVWCEARSVNFGSGTFQSVAVPEPATLGLATLGALSLLRRRRPPLL